MKLPPPVFPSYDRVIEPDLLFHPDRNEDRSPHPLLGLTKFGPYSRSTVNSVLDPIRVAVIAPHAGLQEVDRLFAEFARRHFPKERKNYLPEYLGFSRIFGINIVRSEAVFEFSRELDAQLAKSVNANVLLAQELLRALSVIETKRSQFDVVAIYLPNLGTRFLR